MADDGGGAPPTRADVTPAPGQRVSQHAWAATLALKLILLTMFMVVAYLVLSTGMRGASAALVAAAEHEDRPTGAGVKDAIQDLYAEIKASESDGPGLAAADCLDVATSAKAKYVSDSLRRMIGGEPAAHEDPAVGGGGGDHAGRSADRSSSPGPVSAKDRTRADSRPRNGDPPPPPLSHEDVNELVQRFFDVLDHFDRLKSTSSATTVVAEPRRGGRGPPSAVRRRSFRGVSATQSTPGPGLFKRVMFNRHHVTSSSVVR